MAYALATSDTTTIPDEIIAVATKPGKALLRKEIFQPCLWEKMKSELSIPDNKCIFADTGYNVRVIPSSDRKSDASDVSTGKDVELAADFILDTVRQFSENPDTRITFSISGGRKTMSALGSLAMTLLGRDRDRLCHVLVRPPLDSPLLYPKFYYHSRNNRKYVLDGKVFYSSRSDISICDIPFVRIRNLFPEKFSRLPGSFMDTVDFINKNAPATHAMRLQLNRHDLSLNINGSTISLSFPEFVLYWMLADRASKGKKKIEGEGELHSEVIAFARQITESALPGIGTRYSHFSNERLYDPEYFRKKVSSIKKKIEGTIHFSNGRDFFLPSHARGLYGLNVPAENIDGT